MVPIAAFYLLVGVLAVRRAGNVIAGSLPPI